MNQKIALDNINFMDNKMERSLQRKWFKKLTFNTEEVEVQKT